MKLFKNFCKLYYVLLLVLIIPHQAFSGFGLGFMVGEPTGISLKLPMGKNHVVNGAVSFSTGNNSTLYLHGDYLWRNHNVIPENNLVVYYGPGLRIKIKNGDGGNNKNNNNNDGLELGARLPVGVNYRFPTVSFDIFAELVPKLDLIPDIGFGFGLAIGSRYLF